MTTKTRHEILDGHHEAPEWGTWPLAVGNRTGLAFNRWRQHGRYPQPPGALSNSEFDPIVQLDLEPQTQAHETTLA